MKMFKNRYLWSTFLTATLSANPASLSAAPGPIAESPLFLSSSVQPNIFFLIDDSGSMGWEDLLNAGTSHPGAAIYGVIPRPPSTSSTDWRAWVQRRLTCRGYNVMAYDPGVTYTPWDGVDAGGNPYTDQSLASARRDPFNVLTGTNISNHIYFPWDDADGDGQYDGPGSNNYWQSASGPDAGTLGGGTDECGNIANNGNGQAVSALSAQQQVNYANWYSYYRSRHLVAKKALSNILNSSTARVGLSTLWNNNSVGTVIKDVDDITSPIDTVAQANKAALMRQLFRVSPSGGTPLRQSLRNAGNYFQGSGTVGNLFGGASPADPILPANQGGSCQQNFTILMSDGFWNGNSPSVGNTDADGPGVWDGGAHADGVSNTLGDVAMKYYEEDLDGTLDPDVPTIQGVDINNQQHMVTYTVAFGVNGTLTASPAAGATSFSWPTPSANAMTTVDDMRHAAYNGRGQFLSAGDPETLVNSLDAAISDIQNREGTAAAVSFNSTSIQANSQVFQASFNSAGWHGNLKAFRLNASGGVTLAWDAASLLDARSLTGNPRNIVTHNGTGGVVFDWPSDYNNPASFELGTAQIADLLTNAPFPAGTTVPSEIAANETFGEQILDYLRGDFSNEGPASGQFRERNGHRLGDIVHSSPVFVAEPDTPYPDAMEGSSNLYSTFKATHANRPGRVYVGANDGMLHVLDSDGSGSDGEEVFAYMPGILFSSASDAGLHLLAEHGYNHHYYVDLSPTAADVFVNGAWKTVLLGGLRGGGKGIFALDITNPSQLTEGNAATIPMWEFTHDDLGYTFSEIQVGRLHNGKWAAIFGNGYNNDPNGDGRAKLFIHYLDGSGTVILDTEAGFMANNDCEDAGSDCNGLSTPALADLNGDAIIDRIYAGDLQGNLWVFDVNNKSSGSWGFAYKDTSSDPMPLFQACTSGTCVSSGKAVNRQPITTKPALARHPHRRKNETAPNILVYVGTGQYVTSTDNVSAAKQSFYGIWDGGTFGISPRTSPLMRSDLVSQTITEPTSGRRALTTNSVNYDPKASSPDTPEYGWKIDLSDTKERVAVDSTVVGEILFFNSLIPSTSTCSGGGDGWLMNVDMLTGGMPDFAVVDFNNDGDFENDAVVGGQKIEGVPAASRFIISGKGRLLRITPDSKGNLATGSVRGGPTAAAGRISWTHLEY